MYISARIVISILVLIFLWIISENFYKKIITRTKNDPENDDSTEMENVFYEEVRKGEKYCKLTYIFDQYNLMFIKSLFQSEQIPYRIDSEYSSKIYPGIKMGVYILEKDYDDAVKIINAFKIRIQ